MSDTKIVRTRMAPSPTGELHIGGMRTLLYDYALARQNQGQFILRIEDTDQKRYVPGSETRILEVIKAYGLSWDEGPDIGGPYGPYVQSQRLDIYQKYIQQLLDQKLAYRCFCTETRLEEMRAIQKASKQPPKYDRHCLHLTDAEIEQNLQNKIPFTVRLKVPDNQKIIFNDLIRGRIEFNSSEVDDQVLVKSNGIPTYHFAAVVDDHLMNITHIFRGEEWLTSTPKHVLLYQYFGWEMPSIAHLTVLLDPNSPGKMSKRSGSTHAKSFLDEGYLPEAILNFLMLLGWNPGSEQEIFSLEEFIQAFSLEKLNKKAPVFDRNKLDYFNGLYIRKKTPDELVKLLLPFLPNADPKILSQLVPLIHDRIKTLKEAAVLTKFIFEDVEYDSSLLTSKVDKNTALEMLNQSLSIISQDNLSSVESIQTKLMDLIKTNNWKVGDFFMVFRVAVCGAPQTPPVVDCLPILGKDATIGKINIAIQKLNG